MSHQRSTTTALGNNGGAAIWAKLCSVEQLLSVISPAVRWPGNNQAHIVKRVS